MLVRGTHDRREFREDRADTRRDSRHDGAGSYRNEARHEGIFDQVLTAVVFPNRTEHR
jgi:hypothetical protein